MPTRTLTARERLIATLNTVFCPNSTDAGGTPANHYVKDGGCLICDRSTDAAARLHGLA